MCGRYRLSRRKQLVDEDFGSELLKPYDSRLMRCYPVSARINHVANDDEPYSTPVELARFRVLSSCSGL